MELKVWVDGIQRVVCGVSETTTCQDVVYALAHATGRTGRFTLIERWRNNERLLAPQEHPVKVLMKWGEYSSDVQFILLRSPLEKSPSRARRSGRPAERSPPTPESSTTVLSPELQRRRSDLRLLEHVKRGTVGVVRGVPQRPPEPPWPPHGNSPRRHEKAALNDSVSSSDVSFNTSHDKVPGVRTRPGEPAPSPSLRFSTPPPYREPPAPPIGRVTNNGGSPSSALPPPRRPPPYRDPPPPPPPPAGARGSPLLLRGAPPPPPAGAGAVPPRTAPPTPVSPASQSSQPISGSESTPSPPPPRPEKVRRLGGRGTGTNESYNMNEEVVYNNQYRELLNVVNEQKHQLGSLQADVTKCDAEIVHLEESMREQEVQLSSVRTEASRLQQLLDDRDLEVSELEVTDELKKETEAGERMKEESEQLKNKLSVCETDLAQYSQKIREVSESLEAERCRGEQEARVSQEELSELAGQLQQLQLTAGRAEQERARLEAEMAQLGEQLQQRQTRVEQLLDELKTVNLESLKMASAEELTKVTEGPVKSGLNRQLIGSPRQLENAVPTSKNPHGVWV